jgi:hypothetical protein
MEPFELDLRARLGRAIAAAPTGPAPIVGRPAVARPPRIARPRSDGDHPEDGARVDAPAISRRRLRTAFGLAAGIALLAVALPMALPAGQQATSPVVAPEVAGPLLAVEHLELGGVALQPVEADGRPIAGRDRVVGHRFQRAQSPDGRTLAIFRLPNTNTATGELLLVDLATWTWTHAPITVPSDGVTAPAWTADSRTLAWFEPQSSSLYMPRDYRLMHWTIGDPAPVAGPTLAREFVPEQMRSTDAGSLLVYGQPVGDTFLASGVPEVLLLDLAAGTISDRAELTGVVAGERPGDRVHDERRSGTARNAPGVAWDLPRDRLLVVQGGLLTSVHWETGRLTVDSRVIAPRTSLLDAVVAWVIPAAAAGAPDEGVRLAATLSPDGSRIYLTGTVTEADDTVTVARPFGLHVVDASDGTLLASFDGPIDEIALDPSGTRLVATGTTATYPADGEEVGEFAPADLLILDAVDLHELARVPTPDGVSERTLVGFSADGTQAYVRTFRPAESSLPVIQLLDVATADLKEGRFSPGTWELLPLRP